VPAIVVFDTHCYLRAMLRVGGFYHRLVGPDARYLACASPAIIEEIREVLARPELVAKFPRLLDRSDELENLLDELEVVPGPPPVQVCRDPDDGKFIACALAAKADYLVTEDNDLLVLDGYGGLRIVTPTEFLAAIDQAEESPDGPGETPPEPS
jgi:uncharacterized protein